MTEIDASADVDIIWHDEDLTIRLPLAGEASQEWASRYARMAQRKGIAARAEASPGRAWIVVTLPPYAERSEVLETLDAARELIERADAAGDVSPGHDKQLAAAVRDWWAQRRD
jgi:hypothetical protein